MLIILYLLIGFIWARVDVAFKRELIWGDQAVHTFLLTLFWPLFLLMWLIVQVFKVLGGLIDAIIEMLT